MDVRRVPGSDRVLTEPARVEERRTARLRLRRVQPADSAAVVALHVDPRNYPHSPAGAHTPERAETLAQKFSHDWDRNGIGYWLAEHAGEVVGVIGITPAPLGGRRCWNLYYRFTPAARGRGFAAEAARESLVVAAQIDPERPVVVRTRPGNAPACRLAEAIGLARRPELDAGDGFVVYA